MQQRGGEIAAHPLPQGHVADGLPQKAAISRRSSRSASLLVRVTPGMPYISPSTRYESYAVRSHHSWVRWPNMTPIRPAMLRRLAQGSSPTTLSDPSSGRRIPQMVLMSVDLPAPLSPRSATLSPEAMRNDTSSIARRAGRAAGALRRGRRRRRPGVR